MPPLVSVVFASYRDAELLPRAIRPVFDARMCDVDVLVINNDPAVQIRDALPADIRDGVRVVEMGFNAGFCAACNRGIRTAAGEYVLLANTDVFVESGYLDAMVAFFGRHERAACASGKILRYDLAHNRPTEIVDSAGLAIGRNRRATDRGEGASAAFDREEQVFAASGAALFARRAALLDVAVAGEVLDETYFMYREDLDLGWRLRLRGWECWYVPAARAYHARTTRGLGSASYRSAPLAFHRQQQAKPEAARLYSMRNHWLTLVKNEDAANFVRDLPHIAARETAIVAWTALFSPSTLRGVRSFARLLRPAIAKRRAIKARQRISATELRVWFRRG